MNSSLEMEQIPLSDLSTDLQTKLQSLNEENFAFLEEQLSWKDNYGDEEAKFLVEEYKRWLAILMASEDPTFLAKYFSGVRIYPAMPSKHVDGVWHRHILFTKGYADFCNKVNGKMIHHLPCTKKNVTSFDAGPTFKIYSLLFGKIPSIWKEKDDFLAAISKDLCSKCGGGCGIDG